jgi:hypothetical protein
MKPENAILPGDLSEYLSLSWPCKLRTAPPMMASSAVAATIVKTAICFTAVRVSIFYCRRAKDSLVGSVTACSPSKNLYPINVSLEQLKLSYR